MDNKQLKDRTKQASAAGTQIKKFLTTNAVPILFLIICIIGVYYAKTSIPSILSDLVNRFDRNAILVLSLIIPVISGMGLNFGIVLGAMCGQLGLIVVAIMGMSGLPAVLFAMLIAAVSAGLCGILAGMLLNKTKGQEMIASMILGYFSNGIYQFIFLFVVGGIIKIQSEVMLTGGIGIKNTIALNSLQYSLDNIKIFGYSTKVDVFSALVFFGILFGAYYLFLYLIKKKKGKSIIIKIIAFALMIVFALIATNMDAFAQYKMLIRVPIPSFLLIFVVCILISAFMKTKLGQDMRAIGHDRSVAMAAGINVNLTRIIAICTSTVLAGIGQVIFYQNLGTMDTYYGHEKVGTYCVAAILIGGASVEKATIGQAITGTLLFHLLFNVSPLAAQNLFSNSMVGGYFRMVICYGVIAMALMLHAWNTRQKKKEETK